MKHELKLNEKHGIKVAEHSTLPVWAAEYYFEGIQAQQYAIHCFTQFQGGLRINDKYEFGKDLNRLLKFMDDQFKGLEPDLASSLKQDFKNNDFQSYNSCRQLLGRMTNEQRNEAESVLTEILNKKP
jgi:hypothetical protein